MSARGRMVGSFGQYCIFKTAEGLVVRFETLSHGMRGGRPVVKRSYATINEVAVATLPEAGAIIDQALERNIEVTHGRPEPVQ